MPKLNEFGLTVLASRRGMHNPCNDRSRGNSSLSSVALTAHLWLARVESILELGCCSPYSVYACLAWSAPRESEEGWDPLLCCSNSV
eukprot:5968783-Amphidinium_carterae.2